MNYSDGFNQTVERSLSVEGGYVNDANDPGGETKFGISKRSYPELDILNLTREDAIAIYHRDFWSVINGDRLPASLGYQLFDFAINSGCSTAIRYLQRAVRVADDGYWGPISQIAVDAMSESDLVMALNAERLDFMTRLNNWKHHGKGWARRIAHNLRYGVKDTD